MSKTNETKRNSIEYPLPVYLHEGRAMDLLAMIEDGFSRVWQQKLVETGTKQGNLEGGGKAEGNLLSFINVSLSTTGSSQHASSGTSEVLKERAHTPSSLFRKVLVHLRSQDLLRRAAFGNVSPGDFVEVLATITPDAPLRRLEQLERIIEIAPALQNLQTVLQPAQSSTGKSQRGGAPKTLGPRWEAMKKVVHEMVAELRDETYVELLATSVEPEATSLILSLDRTQLRTPIPSLEGRRYKVLGKVTHALGTGSEGSIPLLSATAFPTFLNTLLEEMSPAISLIDPSASQLKTQVEAPVIQMDVIAIYA